MHNAKSQSNAEANEWKTSSNFRQVDFDQPELCAQARLLACMINGRLVNLSRPDWPQLLAAVTEWFIADGNPNLELLNHKPLYGSNAFFMFQKAQFGTCEKLSNGKWIYTNYNPQTVVSIIRNLCLHCGMDLGNVVITYEPKAWSFERAAQSYSRPASVTPVAAQPTRRHKKIAEQSVAEQLILEQLTNVLSRHFANGYRLDSPIEMTRFRSFAAEDLNEELALSDDELKAYITDCGVCYEGKVYAVSAETRKQIKKLAEDYFADGAQAIFFAEFYAKNEGWLLGSSVVSEEMLTDILRKLFPWLSFTKTYFGYTNASVSSTLESKIRRVWGEDVLLTYDQIAERLQYVPFERIKCALSQNGDFIWSSVETFTHISRIEITDDERESVRTVAARECNARGYVSIIDLPFGDIEDRNYELSITALHNAVYRICLSDKFDKKGKIVTRKGDVLDALTIMKEYCRTLDKCTLDDLLNYEKELTGEIHRQIPMEAGKAILIRIDKTHYVADRFVHFNSDLVDNAIELALKGNYLPLKSFTTFGAFPDCGQTWNLFLLESYCCRFSRRFRFDAPSVNSRNAGAVIRKSCGMDYTEIMTDAVANADIPLKDDMVRRFLFDSGYTGICMIAAKAKEIIEKVKALRKKRD